MSLIPVSCPYFEVTQRAKIILTAVPGVQTATATMDKVNAIIEIKLSLLPCTKSITELQDNVKMFYLIHKRSPTRW